MPKKGTKKVKGYTRSKTLVDLGDIKVKDILTTTHVKSYYRKSKNKKSKGK